jgi:hypothetical protein
VSLESRKAETCLVSAQRDTRAVTRQTVDSIGGFVKQQFRLAGFGHEDSYKKEGTHARHAGLYAITKIAGVAQKLD